MGGNQGPSSTGRAKGNRPTTMAGPQTSVQAKQQPREQPQPQAQTQTLDPDTHKIFVKDLPFNATEQEVYQHFKTHAPQIKKVFLVKDSTTKLSKGTAFVVFDTEEDVKTIIKKVEEESREMEQREAEALEAEKQKAKSLNKRGEEKPAPSTASPLISISLTKRLTGKGDFSSIFASGALSTAPEDEDNPAAPRTILAFQDRRISVFPVVSRLVRIYPGIQTPCRQAPSL